MNTKTYKVVKFDRTAPVVTYPSYAAAAAALRKLDNRYFIQGPKGAFFFEDVMPEVKPWSKSCDMGIHYCPQCDRGIDEAMPDLRIEELTRQLEAERSKVDAEHEAYVDLFHQLSAYEKREIAERANAQLVIHALTFYRNKYEQFGQGYVGCASDALAALQAPEVKA